MILLDAAHQMGSGALVVYQACAWIASIGLVLGYVPQAVRTNKTRKTDDIALPTFLMIAIGGIAFMVQGAMLMYYDSVGAGWSLFLTNLITTLCSVAIFGIKIYNDYFKKKDKKEEEK